MKLPLKRFVAAEKGMLSKALHTIFLSLFALQVAGQVKTPLSRVAYTQSSVNSVPL